MSNEDEERLYKTLERWTVQCNKSVQANEGRQVWNAAPWESD